MREEIGRDRRREGPGSTVESERERRLEAESLRAILEAINHQGTLDQTIDEVLKQLARIVVFDSCSVALGDADGAFRTIAARGYPDPAKVVGLTFRDELTEMLRRSTSAVSVGDVSTTRGSAPRSPAPATSAPGPGSRSWWKARSSASSTSTATASTPSATRTCTARRRWRSRPRPPSARPSSWSACAGTPPHGARGRGGPGRLRRRAGGRDRAPRAGGRARDRVLQRRHARPRRRGHAPLGGGGRRGARRERQPDAGGALGPRDACASARQRRPASRHARSSSCRRTACSWSRCRRQPSPRDARPLRSQRAVRRRPAHGVVRVPRRRRAAPCDPRFGATAKRSPGRSRAPGRSRKVNAKIAARLKSKMKPAPKKGRSGRRRARRSRIAASTRGGG